MGIAALMSGRKNMLRKILLGLMSLAGSMFAAAPAFAAISMAKSFSPSQVYVGQPSVVEIVVNSTQSSAVTQFAVTDQLPAGLQLAASPNAQSPDCASGTNSAAPGATSIRFSGYTVPPGKSCTFRFTVVALDSVAGQSLTNSIPVGNVSNAENVVPSTQTPGVAAQASITVLGAGAFSIQKTFNQWNAWGGAGDYTTYRGKTYGLWLIFSNPNNHNITNLKVNDILPAGVVLTGGAPIANSCGLTVDTSNPTVLRVTGGTLPANPSQDSLQDCRFQVPVTSSSTAVDDTAYTNTITGADVSNAQSDVLSNVPTAKVTYLKPGLQVSKTMTTDTTRYVTTGRTLVRVQVLFAGLGARVQLGSATDPIQSPGILLADGAIANLTSGGTEALTRTTTCAGQTMTGVGGGSSVVMTGGDIPESTQTSGAPPGTGYCLSVFWVEVDGCTTYKNNIDKSTVTASVGGQAIAPDQIYAGYEQWINPDQLMGDLNVYKNYYGGVTYYVNNSWNGGVPGPAPAGTTGTASYVFRNTTGRSFDNVSYSDTFPTQTVGSVSAKNLLLAANPAGGANYSMTCYGSDGTAAAPMSGAGTPTLTMNTWTSGGSTIAFAIDRIPPHTACRVDFFQRAGEPALAPPPYASNWSPPIFNAGAGTLNYVMNPPAGATCVPPVVNNSTSYRIAKDFRITKKFIATGATPGYQEDNNVPAISTVRVGVPFSMVIGFPLPQYASPGQVVRTGITFTDELPAGLVIAATPNVRGFCVKDGVTPTGFSAGTITAAPGTTTFKVDNFTPVYFRDSFMDCGIVVDVVATQPSPLVSGQPVPYTNTIAAGVVTAWPREPLGAAGTVGTIQFLNVNAVAASVVALQPLVQASKEFAPIAVQYGTTTRLRVRVSTSELTLSGIGFTDAMPSGMTVAAATDAGYAAPINTCGGSLDAAANAATITLSGGAIASGARECLVEVSVKLAQPGTYVNTIPIGGVQSSLGSNGQPVSASVTSLPRISVAKQFVPIQIASGGTSRATVTITNPEIAAQDGVRMSDVLPAGLQLAATPAASTTCVDMSGTAVPVTISGTTVGVEKVRLPASGSCEVAFDVTAAVSQTTTFTNIIKVGDVQSDPAAGGSGAVNVVSAQADVVVAAAPVLGVSKSFQPPRIESGAKSRASVTIINPSGTPQVGIKVADNLPAGLLLAAPTGASTTCVDGNGTAVAVAASGTSVSVAGVKLAAGASCTLSFDVTVTVKQETTFTNTIAIAGVQSDPAVPGGSGAINTAEAKADLVGTPPPPLGVAKSFEPAKVAAGAKSRATITVTNAAIAPQVAIKVTDLLPEGLQLAEPTASSTTCVDGNGATVTVAASGTSVSVAGVKLAAGGSCTLSFDVLTPAGRSATYTNVIAVGGAVSDAAAGGSGITNAVEAKAGLEAVGEAVAVPTLGWPMLWVLASLLGLGGMRLRGRRR